MGLGKGLEARLKFGQAKNFVMGKGASVLKIILEDLVQFQGMHILELKPQNQLVRFHKLLS